jgi:hypothetical protein
MYSLNIDPNNPRGNPDPAELRELGVEMVRYTFYDSSGGDQVDRGKADFYRQKASAYRDAGIGSLVILTYDTYPNKPAPDASDQDWDNYINRFANRAGQIAQLLASFRPAYQVWNEPDHPVRPDYSPTLREAVFGRMLRRTRDALKVADPQALTVIGGLSSGNPGWLTTVIQSQGGNLPADIVAFHPYGQRPEPKWPNPNWGFGYVGKLIDDYYKAGQKKPIWITEMGVKEEELGNDREQVAEFIRRYYRTVITKYSNKVPELFWFCYGDGMVQPFGLLDSAGNRKPAYQAFRQAVEARAVWQPTPAPAPPPPPPPPPPPSPPVTPVPVPVGPELAQLVAQIAQLQAQLQQLVGQQAQVQQLSSQQAQLQAQVQQLSSQQAQLQAQVQQLLAQLAVSPPAPTPGVPVTPPPPTTRPMPPIQNITNQLKRDPNKQFPTRPLSEIQMVVIHHTAVAPTVGADRIAEHRVDKQGWPGIGYHYFVTHDGQLQQTNELTTVATHAGDYNPLSMGVCFAGDFTQTGPTPAQIDAGAQLIAWLLQQFNLSLQAVFGYKELVNTQSPGLQWDSGLRWGDQLRQKIQAYL